MNRQDSIDLLNSRLELKTTVGRHRVYDSLEHHYTPPSTILLKNKIHMPKNESGMKPKTLPTTKPNVCRIVTSSRTMTDLRKPAPKSSSVVIIRKTSSLPYDLHFNKTAFVLETHKPRIKSTVINRVLDRVHDIPQDTLAWSLDKCSILGGYLPCAKLLRDKPILTFTDKGPGDYDVDRWYSCEKGRLSTPLLTKFTTAAKDKGAAYPHPSDAPPPTTYFSEAPIRPRTFEDQPAAIFGLSETDRFKSVYKRENFVTSTGLLLSPDHDRRDAWELPDIPVTIDLKAPQRPISLSDYPTTYINPDSGTKMSIKKSAETSPIRYAVAFRNRSPRK